MPRRKRNASPCSDKPWCSEEDGFTKHPQRNAANARERARMRVLSRAFCRLKTTLPWVPADTKLSKLDTLRLATSYIAHLRAILTDQPPNSNPKNPHPLTLTWPFSFQHNGTSNGNCESNTWNSRDSEEDESTNSPTNDHGYQNEDIIRDFAPYYQQYTDSLMHVG